MRPVCAVFGATGNQGGSVATELLREGQYDVRAVTRKPRGQAAAWLDTAGAEVVQADLLDLDSVRSALKGAEAVFAVTNFWNHDIRPKEKQIGIMLAEAAKEAGVQHYVWAGMPNAKKLSKGKYSVTQYTGKAEVWDHIKTLGFPYATSVEATFYYSNLQYFDRGGGMCGITKDSTGNLVLQLTDMTDSSLNTGMDVSEIGQVVTQVLHHPDTYNNKRIRFQSAYHEPMSQWAADLAEATGKPAVFRTAPQGLPHAGPEIQEMMHFMDEFGGSYGGEEASDIIDASHVLGRPLHTFKQWLRESHYIRKL